MRTIIIERWAILRSGLRVVMSHAGHPVIAALATGSDGIEAAAGARDLELVLLGAVGDTDPVTLVSALVTAAPSAAVMLLVDGAERPLIDAVLAAGAAGIVGRLAEGGELLDAIDRCARSSRVLSDEVITTLLGSVARDAPIGHRFRPVGDTELTAREIEVLSWLATGATNRDIAAHLFIGEATVKSHLSSAYAKLGVSDRHRAVARGIELGVIGFRTAS